MECPSVPEGIPFKKYSKSGDKDPMTSAIKFMYLLLLEKGKIAAGCAKVNGKLFPPSKLLYLFYHLLQIFYIF